MIAEQINDNNRIYSEIYRNIVQKFVEDYIVRLSPNFSPPLRLLYKIPNNYEPNNISKLCDEIEKMYKNVSRDKYYHFYTKLFVESAQFSLNIIKKVFELHQKTKKDIAECRKALEANPTLFDDFIISINWLNSLLDSDYEMCLLYNYDHLHAYYENQNNNIRFSYQYRFNPSFTEEESTITNIVKYTQQYYKENDFTSNKKIMENENIQKIREWVDSNNDIEDKFWYKILMKVAIDHIKLYRSMQTEINYLSKPNYTNSNRRIKQKYNITYKQMEFIEKLQLDTIVKDIYNLKFNTMHMHTEETIMEGIALITTFDENIS
ncbi:hypothetical protein BDAP_000144 [Binucleata daphniae]